MTEQAHFKKGLDNGSIDNIDILLKFLLPDRLGGGQYRTTYSMKGTGNVLKIAHRYEDLESFIGIQSNIMEHNLYRAVSNCSELSELKLWLCPVINISNCGKYLVMARTIPLTTGQYKSIANEVPYILTSDMHIGNFGMLKADKNSNGVDRIVMIDYGNVRLEDMFRYVTDKDSDNVTE